MKKTFCRYFCVDCNEYTEMTVDGHNNNNISKIITCIRCKKLKSKKKITIPIVIESDLQKNQSRERTERLKELGLYGGYRDN
jgi:hypothetical protein